MSDQPGRESFEDDLGSYSIDGDDQLGAEDTLDASETDDEPYTPPDQQSRATEWGTTAAEQHQGESLEQRIRQEEPDPDSAYGAPDDEGGLDSDREEEWSEDYVDDGEVGSGRGGEGGPESRAMHVVDEP